ncbi:TauD/TfdA family dioxygenase [Paraburkholderia sediminicola]|uniref:TauD/TfdA family dioxygenase n=1 Tax=Paraburkholderia sediminicola TaxID=458836 RepID=UPI0038B959E8
MSAELRKINFSDNESGKLKSLVTKVHEDCPSQIQSRYLSRLEAYEDQFPIRLTDIFWEDPRPLLLTNLPTFSDVEGSKILVLSIGEAIGKCAGYSEYNQSYITDIRPSTLSNESSSGTELLTMHNDLTFASDHCRPSALALVAHTAEGNVPKTLLADAVEIASLLSSAELNLLQQNIYEIRAGGKLRWPCEQVRRISVLEHDASGRLRIHMSFNNICPISGLDETTTHQANDALKRVTEIALEVGRAKGHVVKKGQALLIPNDYVLHGRDVFEDENFERLLFRSYVITREMARRQNGNTMISLRL